MLLADREGGQAYWLISAIRYINIDCSGTKVYNNFNSPKALIIKLSLVFYKKMHFLFFHFYLFCWFSVHSETSGDPLLGSKILERRLDLLLKSWVRVATKILWRFRGRATCQKLVYANHFHPLLSCEHDPLIEIYKLKYCFGNW